MKRKIKWAFWWAFVFASLYFAKFQASQPAWNLLRFYIVVGFILSLFIFHDKAKEAVQKQGRTVPGWLSWGAELIFLGVMLWFGHFFYAALSLISQTLILSAFSEAEEQKENENR